MQEGRYLYDLQCRCHAGVLVVITCMPAHTALARVGYRIDRNWVTVRLAFTLDEWADDDVAFTTRLEDDEGWATGLAALCEALKEKTPSALALPLTCARQSSFAVH